MHFLIKKIYIIIYILIYIIIYIKIYIKPHKERQTIIYKNI